MALGMREAIVSAITGKSDGLKKLLGVRGRPLEGEGTAGVREEIRALVGDQMPKRRTRRGE